MCIRAFRRVEKYVGGSAGAAVRAGGGGARGDRYPPIPNALLRGDVYRALLEATKAVDGGAGCDRYRTIRKAIVALAVAPPAMARAVIVKR